MRNFRSAFLRFIVPVSLAASLWLLGSCRRGPALESWSLPSDFTEHQDGLKTLLLPAQVTRFDWLSDDLQHLEAPRSAASVVRGFPGHLQSLDLRYSEVRFLADLPDDLRELDLRFANLTKVPDLPDGITRLALGGDTISTYKGVPLNLVELTLEEAPRLANLYELPRELKSLTLIGTSFTDLRGLPPYLQSLTLRWTGVKALVDLPDSIHTLVLDSNLQLQIGDDLPPFLTTLIIEGSPVPDLSHLSHLVELGVSSWDTSQKLPRTLRTLRLNGTEIPQDMRTLPSIRTLGILRSHLEDASLLPSHLERLELQGSVLPGLNEAPVQWNSLRYLDLSWTAISLLPPLPPDLEWLDITETHIGDPQVQPRDQEPPPLGNHECLTNIVDLNGLPGNLLTLNFRRSMATELKGLPESLEALDVSDSRCLHRITGHLPKLSNLNLRGTAIKSVAELPKAIRTLDVSETGVNSLAGITSDLQELTVCQGQLRALAGLKNLQTLRFVEPLDPDRIDP